MRKYLCTSRHARTGEAATPKIGQGDRTIAHLENVAETSVKTNTKKPTIEAKRENHFVNCSTKTPKCFIFFLIWFWSLNESDSVFSNTEPHQLVPVPMLSKFPASDCMLSAHFCRNSRCPTLKNCLPNIFRSLSSFESAFSKLFAVIFFFYHNIISVCFIYPHLAFQAFL